MAEESIALVVNAGGLSRRMGREKALLPVPPDHVPLLVHIVRRLAVLVSERVVVVTNNGTVAGAAATLANTIVVADRWPEAGAIGGVATGLEQCSGWAMVVACDMPLVDPAIFAKLVDLAHAQPFLDAVIPRINGRAQPFHGLWHRRALPVLEECIQTGELAVQAALAQMNCAWVDEHTLMIRADDPAFTNVNTPQEWEAVLALMAQSKRPVA